MAHQQGRVSKYGWNGDYSDHFFWHLDTMPVKQLESYLAYTEQRATSKATAPLDRWLGNAIRHDATFFHELIGTKYLRLAQWQKAVEHLEKVPLSYVNTMNIVPFMAQRSYQVEPWMKRQRIKEEDQYPGHAQVSENQKLNFAREMLLLEKDLDNLIGQEQAQRAYLLAVRYTQASYAGDAWYLTRYGKSVMDEQRKDEANLLGKADDMLCIALSQGDFAWKEKVLFARAFLPVDQWYRTEWNDKCLDYDLIPQPDSHQYKALHALLDFERQHSSQTSEYVSNCDVLKQFSKAQ